MAIAHAVAIPAYGCIFICGSGKEEGVLQVVVMLIGQADSDGRGGAYEWYIGKSCLAAPFEPDPLFLAAVAVAGGLSLVVFAYAQALAAFVDAEDMKVAEIKIPEMLHGVVPEEMVHIMLAEQVNVLAGTIIALVMYKRQVCGKRYFSNH